MMMSKEMMQEQEPTTLTPTRRVKAASRALFPLPFARAFLQQERPSDGKERRRRGYLPTPPYS